MQHSDARQPIQVTCYSGETYAERPEAFMWEGQAHRVRSIEKEWLEPGEKRFRVSTDGNRLFELCHDEQRDEWSLIEFITRMPLS